MPSWSQAQRSEHRFVELHDDDGHLVATACNDGDLWDCAVLVRVNGCIASIVEWTDGGWLAERSIQLTCEHKLWRAHRLQRAHQLPARVAHGRTLPKLSGRPRREAA